MLKKSFITDDNELFQLDSYWPFFESIEKLNKTIKSSSQSITSKYWEERVVDWVLQLIPSKSYY